MKKLRHYDPRVELSLTEDEATAVTDAVSAVRDMELYDPDNAGHSPAFTKEALDSIERKVEEGRGKIREFFRRATENDDDVKASNSRRYLPRPDGQGERG